MDRYVNKQKFNKGDNVILKCAVKGESKKVKIIFEDSIQTPAQ
jgi:hypothetical protein